MKQKRITIKDVAYAAGTSIATASRVISNANYPVSAKLRQKVLRAVNELRFVPHENTYLQKRESNDIGVVIPNITNQFYLQALVEITKIAGQKGYSIILCNTNRSIDEEGRFLDELFERHVKGIIISPMDGSAQRIKNYVESGMNFVLLDQHFEDLTCPSIKFDCRLGAKMATEYLIENGHREIAFISAPITRWSRQELLKGYRSALTNHSIVPNEDWLFVSQVEYEMKDGNYELEVGKELAQKFVSRKLKVTAVLCNNDMVAISFIQALKDYHLSVPEDVSVIGFDNIPLAGYISPSLTTVSYPSSETGRLAMTLLHNNIESMKEFSNLDMSLVPKIISRGTVKRLK